MVSHDDLFKKDFSKMSDNDLKAFRHEQVANLFNGYKGSVDNVEREALIGEVDREIEIRFKKKAEIRSNTALLISVIAIAISVITLILNYFL